MEKLSTDFINSHKINIDNSQKKAFITKLAMHIQCLIVNITSIISAFTIMTNSKKILPEHVDKAREYILSKCFQKKITGGNNTVLPSTYFGGVESMYNASNANTGTHLNADLSGGVARPAMGPTGPMRGGNNTVLPPTYFGGVESMYNASNANTGTHLNIDLGSGVARPAMGHEGMMTMKGGSHNSMIHSSTVKKLIKSIISSNNLSISVKAYNKCLEIIHIYLESFSTYMKNKTVTIDKFDKILKLKKHQVFN